MNKIQTLKIYFGYDSFRPGQEEIIDQILSGRDVLAVMPTGAGKSLCYQLPALLMPGITVVVSPLISLMMDQVKALNEAGVHAAYINSSLTETQITKALELAAAGRYKIIYVAPERLETPRFLDFACHTELSMVTVDEAHCISQWGQDFRPSYVRILSFIRQLPVRPVISAFTATATERVREDILASLELVHPFETVTGFDRPNLYFEVQKARDKKERIHNYVESHREESGIIYCATRKGVDELYLYLENAGFQAGRYHAGMSADARKKSQEDFIYDRIKVMIATNAFGMGIDKSNVRYVLHYNMPQSMENYYQEAGRAGRDGEPSECILYYSPQDTVINRMLLESKENYREYTEEELQVIRAQDMERLRKMEAYCTTTNCLRNSILTYFGEMAEERCGNCSNCLEEFEEMDASEAAADVVRCVRSCGQRYGMNMIAGTLLGENTAKIRNSRMDQNPAYGSQSKLGQSLIKEVIRNMLEQGYLRQTQDKYSLIKLTERSDALLEGEVPFLVRYKKEEMTGRSANASAKGQSRGKRAAQAAELTEKGRKLFEELRSLRTVLAKERSVPPYMVASDRTLRDMCVRIPLTKEEMLDVNGMGAKKLEQYGDKFLEKILDVTGGDRKAWGAEVLSADSGTTSEPTLFGPFTDENERLRFLEENADEGEEKPLTEKKGKSRKANFHLTEEILAGIRYVPETTISDFVSQINELRDENAMKRLTIKSLTEKLLEEGCFEQRFQNGYTRKILTEKGKENGIRSEERISSNGNPYEVFLYTEKGQRYLTEILKGEYES